MAGERTLPGISLTAFWNEGDDTWKAGMDENLRKLSVFVQLRVLSRVVFPGFEDSNSAGVANGDIYLVPNSDSNSQQNSNSTPLQDWIAVHDNGSWVYYQPLEGFRAYVIDEDLFYVYKNGDWVPDGGDATAITYNSGSSGDSNSTATSVAEALDDLYKRIRDISVGAVDAYTIPYASQDGGDSNSVESTVGDALDDLYSSVNTLQTQIGGITFEAITASLTLDATDDKKWFLASDSSNSPAFIDIGVPADSLLDLPDGFTVSVTQLNDSQVRFIAVEDSNSPDDVTFIYPADMQPQTRGARSTISIVKTNVANTWIIFGDTEAV